MAYGDSAARVRSAKQKEWDLGFPGALEDAIQIAKKQGAKTEKQIQKEAKRILGSRKVDAAKNVTRAKMQDPNVKLGRRFASTQTSKKAAPKPATKKVTSKSTAKKSGK